MRINNRKKNFKPVKHKRKKFYKLNHYIDNPELRVITADGQQLGILEKSNALLEAQEREEDLVLIAPNASPPVAKIINFKKFLYQEEKKEKEAKKGVKKSIVKDLKLSLFISSNDFDRQVEKGKEFLADGNQLRVNLTLKGREMIKKQMGLDMLSRFIVALGEVNVSKEPRLEGRVVRAVISRKK